MGMNSRMLLAAGLMAVFVMGYSGASTMAYAQYMGNVGTGGETGQNTLEENLMLAEARIKAAEDNPVADLELHTLMQAVCWAHQ